MIEGKDNWDAVMSFNDFCFKRCHNLRTYEWCLSFALWAWMVAAIYYLQILPTAKEPPPKLPPHSICISVIVLFVIVALHVIWVRTNWRRNMKDINCAFYYWDRARVLLPGELGLDPQPLEDQGPRSKRGGLQEKQTTWCYFLSDALPVSEILVTVVLAFSYVVLELLR
jgi:hypothetical protein